MSQPLDHFFDQVHVARLGQVVAAQQVVDHQPVQQADAQPPPSARCARWPLRPSVRRPASVSVASIQRPSSACTARACPGRRPSRCLPRRSCAASGPSPAGRVRERSRPAWRPARSTVIGRQAAEQPVRRQHDQARIVHATHIISTKLAGCSGERPAVVDQLVAVVAGRLVAVVAVGDEDRLRAHQRRPRPRSPPRRSPARGDGPRPGDRWPPAAARRRWPFSSRSWASPSGRDTGRRSGSGSPCRPGQHQPIRLGPGRVSSCGKTLPSPNRASRMPGHEAAAGERLAAAWSNSWW